MLHIGLCDFSIKQKTKQNEMLKKKPKPSTINCIGWKILQFASEENDRYSQRDVEEVSTNIVRHLKGVTTTILDPGWKTACTIPLHIA